MSSHFFFYEHLSKEENLKLICQSFTAEDAVAHVYDEDSGYTYGGKYVWFPLTITQVLEKINKLAPQIQIKGKPDGEKYKLQEAQIHVMNKGKLEFKTNTHIIL